MASIGDAAAKLLAVLAMTGEAAASGEAAETRPSFCSVPLITMAV